jgi:two-component system sensor histidine kinase TctE
MLKTDKVPTELTPLVEAFNDYIQRLESYTKLRGIFIQNTAHQVRTPIAVLSTQISDALRAENKESTDAFLQNARKTLQQTTRLVNQFLTLSSAEAEAEATTILSTKDCREIVKRVLEELAFQAHIKNIDLGFESTGSDSAIAGNPAEFREIVVNLIDNAIRYTPNGGVVTVRIQSNDNGMALAVEDNGPGIPIGEHERIFERFYRMEGTASTGSGLGLAIVKELASKCGASVRIDMNDRSAGLLIVVDFLGNDRSSYARTHGPETGPCVRD